MRVYSQDAIFLIILVASGTEGFILSDLRYRSGEFMFKSRILVLGFLSAVITINVAFQSGDKIAVSAQDLAPGSTTQTFSNTAAITINDNGNASPYPSNINVTGVSSFTRMEVRLVGFSHTYPDDVDILLVGPQGQRAILMSDAGDNFDVGSISFSFSQTATTPVPDSTTLFQSSQPFRPGNYQNGPGVLTDTFPAPGPGVLTDAPPDLFVFNATNPNGIWNLYVVDDAGTDVGSIAGGWTLTFTVPQIFTVTKTADTNDGTCNADCSLREAITAAQDGDLIQFSSLFDTPQTIDLLTALPDITRNITIQGKGANLTTVRRAFNAATDFRIFTIASGITNGVAINGLTISNGRIVDEFGGGISSESLLFLNNVHVTGNHASGGGGGVSMEYVGGVFQNCTFSNNFAGGAVGDGGGISLSGGNGQFLRLINSTVTGNVSGDSVGGIANSSFSGDSRLEIINSTIVNNKAVVSGGVETITVGAGTTATTTLRNTIVTGNSPANLRAETSGGGPATIQTLGFNLSDNYNGVFTPLASDITSATPRLAPLANYGGQTPTHALLHASPAINAGDSSGQAIDQRGLNRVFGATADIGAVEMRPLVVTSTANGGAGSLRNALGSSGNATLTDIQFDNGVFGAPQTISLTGGQLGIFFNANLLAPGANLLTISGNNSNRIFEVPNTITASISGMTLLQGAVGGGNGGCILNQGSVSITNSTLSGCLSVFEGGGIYNTGSLIVNSSTISGGFASGSGGAIFSTPSGLVTLSNSTISGNNATSGTTGIGGGIASQGGLAVMNSTISGNIAGNSENLSSCGGGIYSSGTLTVVNSTVTGNTVSQTGGGTQAGGILRAGGAATVRNSIVAANVNNGTVADVNAVGATGFASSGFNLIGNRGNLTFGATGDQSSTGASPLNPQLGSLQNNGGTTATHSLLANSPALDKGNSSGSTSDQRGSARPIDLAGITNTSDGSDIGAFEAQTAPVGLSRAPFDYDGDNKTDVSIFRPGPGEWWVLRSSNGSNFATTFGNAADKIVPADYTGDNKADVAFWRPSNGNWFILRSEDFTFFAFPFGANGDVPVPGDFDGDSKADYALFRPSSLNWFILKSTGGTDILTFGAAGDKPVVADYDGDAKADIAIYRTNGANQEWWIRRSSTGAVFAAVFGTPTDKAVQGDYTGDGKADIAFWRPSNGNWFILRSEDFSFFAFPFGATGDVPVPGDYDADGKFDAGVFRPSSSFWFVQRSTAGTLIQQFGIANDIPTPSAYTPQ